MIVQNGFGATNLPAGIHFVGTELSRFSIVLADPVADPEPALQMGAANRFVLRHARTMQLRVLFEPVAVAAMGHLVLPTYSGWHLGNARNVFGKSIRYREYSTASTLYTVTCVVHRKRQSMESILGTIRYMHLNYWCHMLDAYTCSRRGP